MTLKITLDELYDSMDHNQIDIAYLQAYSRRDNIEIIGIPDSVSNHDLEYTVIDILKTMNIEVTSYEIAGCHRLRKERNSRFTPVIVRFTNRKIVFNCLRNCYKLKTYYFGDR